MHFSGHPCLWEAHFDIKYKNNIHDTGWGSVLQSLGGWPCPNRKQDAEEKPSICYELCELGQVT